MIILRTLCKMLNSVIRIFRYLPKYKYVNDSVNTFKSMLGISENHYKNDEWILSNV